MAKYIEQEDLLELYRMDDPVLNENGHVPLPVIRQNIMDIPAADVAPVRHGRWEDSVDEWFGTDVYTCSKCRESYVLVEGTPKENLWHYCPNCGAKMDRCADNE